MRPYMRLGEVPRKRHMRFQENGRLAFEELFGREGFSGPSSLIYHRHMPEGAQDVTEGPADLMTPEHEQVHENAHLKGFELQPDGNGVSGRQYLLVNDDVRIGLVLPASKQEVLYVNGSADEVLFIHEGSGTLRSQFGSLRFGRHDYVVIPRGTIHRIDLDDISAARILCLEVTGFVDVPDRYRARNGQLTEIAPYSERDFRGPDALESGSGPVEVWQGGGSWPGIVGPGERVEQPGTLLNARSVVLFLPSRTMVEPLFNLSRRAPWQDRAAIGWRGDVTTGGMSCLEHRSIRACADLLSARTLKVP